MYRAFLIFFMSSLALLASCAPSSESGDQKDEKSQIVASLNKGDNSGALEKINIALTQNPDDLELIYFKAQALSSQTGIDVYSLFPVLKIKLFEVAVTEWQSFQKYKDLSQSAATNSLNPEDQGDVLAAIDIMLKQLEEMDPTDIAYSVGKSASWYSVSEKTCVRYFEISSEILKKLDKNKVLREEDSTLSYYAYLPEGQACTDEDRNANKHLVFTAKQRLLGDAKYQLRRRKRETTRAKKTAAAIQGVYMLFEAVPILRQLPNYQPENLSRTSEALNLLQEIRKRQDKEQHFGKNARQQITLIAGYLLASSLKDALDLPNVNKPNDVLCRLRAETVAEKYSIGLVAGKHLFEVLQDTEIFAKNRERLEKEITIEKLREDIYSLPEKPTDEIKKRIIHFVHKLQSEHC